MALFNSEAKVEKQLQKEQELLARYGLDELTNPTEIESARKIINLISAALSENNLEKKQATYLNAIAAQNFMIIRLLEKLVDK